MRLRLPLAALALGLFCPPPAGAVRPPDSFLATLAARPLGPANMSGRATAVAVVESNPNVQYVGAAAGGVWKTTNGGKSWRPLFDDQPTAAIGAVALAPSDPKVVWVGTGEANARNSVSWGNGVYLSRDGGLTWAHRGLDESHHVGKIVVHPRSPDTAYVAALGHLWGRNRERGVFKTTDGGKTWRHSLALDDETGAVDLSLSPDDPEVVFACAYRVRRDGFSGGNPVVQFGPRAGLYRSRDGGKSWQRLARGLPTRPYGRCGIAVHRKNGRVLYAVIATDWTNVARVHGQPPRANGDPETGGVFRSDDGGDSWVKVNDLCPRPFYFGQIRIDPSDDRRLWVLGIPLYVSGDGGRNFSPRGAPRVHVDHHDLWVNPASPNHLVLGTDGGVYYSDTGGSSWRHARALPLGQFYGIALDRRRPYRIYGGLQDNGSWGGPSRTGSPEGITLAHWKRVLPADGFQCQVDPTDPDTVYVEAQYGKLVRVDLRLGRRYSIRPTPPRGVAPFRFNWSAPLLLSPHDPRTVYYGGQYLFRSADRGHTWRPISPDLTRGLFGVTSPAGHTLTTIAESPVKPGVLWTGSDDGMVHVSKDGGATWYNCSERVPGLPASRWVTRVEASPFDAGTAYLSIDRHRQDDRAPYLFVTTNFGSSWRPLAAGLPRNGPVHVVRADPRNRALLYAGTEHGLFASLDGATWFRLRHGLPTAPVHDLVVHPRDRELVVATHGRGLFVLDAAPLQELKALVLAARVHLFEVKPALLMPRGERPALPSLFAAPNPPDGALIYYWLREKVAQPVKVVVRDSAGKVVAELRGPDGPGLHRLSWAAKATGEYEATLTVGAQAQARKFRVEAADS